MKPTPRASSVFSRVREHARSNHVFTPTAIRVSSDAGGRPCRQELGIYASAEKFAALMGLSEEAVALLIETGRLSHIRLQPDGVMINVDKGIRDISRLEKASDSDAGKC